MTETINLDDVNLETTPAQGEHGASTAQVEFATKLGLRLAELAGTDAERVQELDMVRTAWPLMLRNPRLMSSAIDSMKASIRTWEATDTQAGPAAASGAPEGMHRLDGEIYKVQRAVTGSGRPYAKKLTKAGGGAWRFEYARGVVYRLSEATQMTLDEAQEWGALYGTCCVCGRALTNETSIAAGIGPVCARRF